MAFGPALMWKMGGDTSGFTKAVGSAEKRTSKFKTMLKSIGPAFSVGLAIAGLKRLTAEMDATAKTARKLGVAPELLQEMRFAADRTGVAQNALDMGLQRFTRRMAEAAQGGGELKGVLDQYNISVKNADGSTRSNVDVLGDLAEVIKNTKDPAEQLRIAFKAFDSEGAAMVNTLRAGRDGLAELRQQARDTGNVVGGETLAQFETLSDQIGTMEGSIKSLAGVAVGAFLTFGERVGQGAAMAVNALQGIPSVLDDGVVPAADRTVAAMGDVIGKIEDLKRITDELRSIDQIYADYDFKRLTAAEKVNQLQAEYNALNEQALTTTLTSNEGLELHRQLAEKFVALKEAEQALSEENAKQETVATMSAEERALAYEQIAGTAEYAVAAAKAIAAAEKEASAAAWDRYNANMKSISIGTGGDNVEGMSSEQLEYLLRQQKDELRASQDAEKPGVFSISTKFISAGIQNFINQIEQELATRRQFGVAQNSGTLGLQFDPWEIDRLRGVTGGLTSDEANQRLLTDIRDGIDDINSSRARY